MKFGVVIFPGSNCDHDIIYVLRNILGLEVAELWHKDHDLQGSEFIILPGGFSYGDYLRCGAVARFSPIMENVIAYANKGGYVMGICNGFQVLCEAHLLPGVLLRNKEQKFICKNTWIAPATKNSLLTRNLDPERPLNIPIAHAEGRFFAKEDSLKEIEDNDQVVFRYCDAAGTISEKSNSNGSLNNIAGITNKGRNIFGMMPHPERAADEALGNTDGRLIFESLLNLVKQ
ncbi:MAG: phosphoribosylformylglycinamidine synthase subunit PurQ [Bacteroidia bacterium]